MIIYKITNLVNGKFYIGKTEQTIEKRWKRHLQDVGKTSRPLYLAIAKYGATNFSISPVETCVDKNHLREREIFWIATLRSTVLDGNYNIDKGGGGGYIIENWPEERKRELYIQQASKRTGQRRSESSKLKMSEAAKLREATKTEDVKQRIRDANSINMKRQYESGERQIHTPKILGKDHHKWVDIDIDDVLSMIQNCYTLKQIAAKYSTTTVTVGARLKATTGYTFIEWRRNYGIKGRLSKPRID